MARGSPSGSVRKSSADDNEGTPRLSANFGVSGCATPDLAMIRWIAYIKSLNLEIRHISGKDNTTADMLSRARFDDKEDMISEDEEIGVDFFETTYITTRKESTPALNKFDKRKYDRE